MTGADLEPQSTPFIRRRPLSIVGQCRQYVSPLVYRFFRPAFQFFIFLYFIDLYMLRCASGNLSAVHYALCAALCAVYSGPQHRSDILSFPFISILRTLSRSLTLSYPYLYISVPLGWPVKLPAYCPLPTVCLRASTTRNPPAIGLILMDDMDGSSTGPTRMARLDSRTDI